eukprot:gb/GECG01011254.1/.p1 GENE.gb/GECG01011254.1/~~gb/GECG01011254.1/.p1  ORF type:complete len:103 (+),score=5.05 gb/GECG01011254.1/:1-309(+)
MKYTSIIPVSAGGYERPQQQPVTVNVHSPEQKQEEHSDKESVAEHAIQMLSNISAQFENVSPYIRSFNCCPYIRSFNCYFLTFLIPISESKPMGGVVVWTPR